MVVRQAQPGDEAVLRALRLEALAEAPEAFSSTLGRERDRTPEDWRRWFEPGATFFAEPDAAGPDRAPDGLVAVALDDAGGDVAQLLSLWVRPEARGAGVADALVAEAVAWSVRAGAHTLRLFVAPDNQPARRLYQRHGFEPTGHHSVRVSTPTPGLEMIDLEMARPTRPSPGQMTATS